MRNFTYRALDPQGVLQQGSVKANQPQEARQILQSKAWRVLSIEQSTIAPVPYKPKLTHKLN